MTMTKTKVLALAAVITALGILQVTHWLGDRSRAAALGKVSGMFALFTAVGMGIYGMQLKNKKDS